jgi:hypothetical protein
MADASTSGDPAIAQPWLLFSPARRWTMLAVLFLVSTVSNIDRQIMSCLSSEHLAQIAA